MVIPKAHRVDGRGVDLKGADEVKDADRDLHARAEPDQNRVLRAPRETRVRFHTREVHGKHVIASRGQAVRAREAHPIAVRACRCEENRIGKNGHVRVCRMAFWRDAPS